MYLVAGDFLLHVVLEEIPEALLVPICQTTHAVFELLLVEDVAHAQATPRHLGAIRWADALLRGADQPATELDLLQPINHLMHIEHDLRAIADEDPPLGIQPLLVQGLELLEETRHVNHTPGPNNIDAPRVHQPRRQNMKVVGNAVGNDGVPRVVAALCAAAQLRLVSEDISEFSFSLVAPLGAEHDGDGHREDENVGGELGRAGGGL